MTKKKEPLRVTIVNPEAIPIAQERLTKSLIKLHEKHLRERALKEMEQVEA